MVDERKRSWMEEGRKGDRRVEGSSEPKLTVIFTKLKDSKVEIQLTKNSTPTNGLYKG